MRLFWVLLSCIAVVAGVARGVAAGPNTAADAPRQRVEVRAGDTLWGLGRRYAPAGTDLRVWINRVEVANGLHGAGLMPGEVLSLPR